PSLSSRAPSVSHSSRVPVLCFVIAPLPGFARSAVSPAAVQHLSTARRIEVSELAESIFSLDVAKATSEVPKADAHARATPTNVCDDPLKADIAAATRSTTMPDNESPGTRGYPACKFDPPGGGSESKIDPWGVAVSGFPL